MKTAIIFRHELFRVSEPFIAQQAGQLQRFRPLYLCRERVGDRPESSEVLALQDLPDQRGLVAKSWQILTRDPRPYMRLLGDRVPSLIHAHFGVEGVHALRLSRRLDVPLITTFHGFDASVSGRGLVRSGSPSWISYLMLRHELAKHGSLFLCVSEFIRRRVLALGFPEERTRVHHIGTDTLAVQSRSLEDERPIVLHVARLVEKKGTEYLIRAFALVADRTPKFTMIIIGDGPLRSKLQSLADALGLGDQVRFMGAQPHAKVIAWMRRSACLVLPSVTARNGDAEGLPVVFLEAAALGLPLIGTFHGGIPEVVINGETGFLVAERDVTVLARRLGELMSDKSGRRRMGRAARVLAESRFDIRRQTEKLEAFYDDVLK